MMTSIRRLAIGFVIASLNLWLAAGASAATITGTITNNSGGAGIQNASIQLFDSNGSFVSLTSQTFSNASGVYSVTVPASEIVVAVNPDRQPWRT